MKVIEIGGSEAISNQQYNTNTKQMRLFSDILLYFSTRPEISVSRCTMSTETSGILFWNEFNHQSFSRLNAELVQLELGVFKMLRVR